jgi:Polymerase beta, Nucleotidyltransferase
VDEVAIAFWGSTTLPRLLAHLTERPEDEFTLGELELALGANRESLHRALGRAVATGLVVRRPIGRRYVYRADQSSPFYPEVRSLCSKMLGPIGLLTAALEVAAPGLVEQAFIYGSTARGTDRPASDIDLMVIGSATDFDLATLLGEAVERSPRAVNAFAYTRREIDEALARGDPFFLEVWAQPKTMLVGREEDLPAISEAMRR